MVKSLRPEPCRYGSKGLVNWFISDANAVKFSTSQQNQHFRHLIRVPARDKDKNVVLSFSSDNDLLHERELALRTCGFDVVSVRTASEARFEIEMGRCGTLLICFRTRSDTVRDVINLFRQNCPAGCVIFVTDQSNEGTPRDADYVIAESGGPEAIVRALSDMGRSPLRRAV